MPTIPEFSVTQGRQAASAVKVTPSEEAIQTLQQGARNISRLTNEQAQYTRQVGQDIGRGLGALGAGAVSLGKAVEQHQTLQEISSMGPSFANMTNSIVDQMHAAIQSNDPEAIQKFRDNVETQLDTWQAGATSPGARAHAITQVDQLRNHILGTWLPGEMATSAYHKAVTDLGTMSNTYSSLAANKPETLDSIIPMMGSQIDTLVANHTLTPGSAEELKGLKQREIGKVIMTAATSVLRGNPAAGIASNPDEVRQWPKRFGAWLTPEQQQHIISEADAQDRVVKVQGRADEAEQRRLENDVGKAAVTNVVAGMMQPDGTMRVGPTTVHDIVNAAALPGNQRDPTLVQSTMKMVNSIVERQHAGKEIVSDPATLASLQAKALSGDLTPTELYQNASKLSQKDLANTYTMMERLEKSGSEFRNDSQLLKSTLNYGFGKLGVDPTLPTTMKPEGIKFQTWFNAAASKAQREGKLPEFSTQLANAPDSFWESFKTTAAPNPGSGLAVPGPIPATPAEGVGAKVYNYLFGTPK